MCRWRIKKQSRSNRTKRQQCTRTVRYFVNTDRYSVVVWLTGENFKISFFFLEKYLSNFLVANHFGINDWNQLCMKKVFFFPNFVIRLNWPRTSDKVKSILFEPLLCTFVIFVKQYFHFPQDILSRTSERRKKKKRKLKNYYKTIINIILNYWILVLKIILGTLRFMHNFRLTIYLSSKLKSSRKFSCTNLILTFYGSCIVIIKHNKYI